MTGTNGGDGGDGDGDGEGMVTGWSTLVLPSPSCADACIDTFATPVSSHQLSPFSGRDCDWEDFKGSASKMFRLLKINVWGSRADIPSSKNVQLFQLLEGACANGKASFLLQLYRPSRDGHGLWQNLVSFYEEDNALTRMAETKFGELINLEVGALSLAKFLCKFVRLTSILETTGYGIKPAMQRFWLLQKVGKHSLYHENVQNLRNQSADLETCFAQLVARSQEILSSQEPGKRSSEKSTTSCADHYPKKKRNESHKGGKDPNRFSLHNGKQVQLGAASNNHESDDDVDSSDDEKDSARGIRYGKRMVFGKKMVPASNMDRDDAVDSGSDADKDAEDNDDDDDADDDDNNDNEGNSKDDHDHDDDENANKDYEHDDKHSDDEDNDNLDDAHHVHNNVFVNDDDNGHSSSLRQNNEQPDIKYGKTTKNGNDTDENEDGHARSLCRHIDFDADAGGTDDAKNGNEMDENEESLSDKNNGGTYEKGGTERGENNDGIGEKRVDRGVDVPSDDMEMETDGTNSIRPSNDTPYSPRRGKTRLQTHSMLERMFEQERQRESTVNKPTGDAEYGSKTPTRSSPEGEESGEKGVVTPSETSTATDASGLDDASIHLDMLDDYIQLFADFDVDVGGDDGNDDHNDDTDNNNNNNIMMCSERKSAGKSMVASGKKRLLDDIMSVGSNASDEELDANTGDGSLRNCFSEPPQMSAKKVPRKNQSLATGKRLHRGSSGKSRGNKSRRLTHDDADVRSILEEASSMGSDCRKLIASAQNLYVLAKDRALQIIKEKGLSVLTSHLERIRERELTSSAARLLQALSCRVVSVVIHTCHSDLAADSSLRETVSRSRISTEIMENLKNARKLPPQANFELIRALANLTGVDGHCDQFWTKESLGVIEAVMRQHRFNVAIQLEACRRLQAFALVPLSEDKGGDTKKESLMMESGALDAVVTALEKHGHCNGDLLEAGCGTLLNVIKSREVRMEMGKTIPIILKAVSHFNVVEEGGTTGGSPNERTGKKRNRRQQVAKDVHPTMFMAAYAAIHNLVVGCHDNVELAAADGGADIILQTMNHHCDNEKLQERICILLSHMAWIPRAVPHLSKSYIFGSLLVALHRHLPSAVIVENALGILKYLDFYFLPNDWHSKLSWSFGAPSMNVAPVTGIDRTCSSSSSEKQWCRPCTAAVHLIVAAWRAHEKNERIRGSVKQALHNISAGVNGRKNAEVMEVLKEKKLESLLLPAASVEIVKLEAIEGQDMPGGNTAADAIEVASDSEGEDGYFSCL